MKHTHRERKIVKERKGREREKHKKREYLNFPPNVFSLFFFFSTLFLLFSSFFFVFIYLFICFLSLTFHFWFYFVFFNFCFLSLTFHFFYYFSFVLLFFFSFLFFLSVFGRPRSFGIPKTSSGPSNPEIHSLLTFMSLRSNSDEWLLTQSIKSFLDSRDESS